MTGVRRAASGQHGPVAQAVLEADYVVVGAGAMGMAFSDALVGHADIGVVLVDRRYGVGGHRLNAYPLVRLHQASSTYGWRPRCSATTGSRRAVPRRHGRAGLGVGDLPVLRACAEGATARLRPGFLLPQLRLHRRGAVRLAGVGAAVRGARPPTHRQRPLPLADDPGDEPAALRGRRGGSGAPGQRPGRPGRPGRGAVAVRDRRLGQDRDRRLHLAARPRRRSRRDRLGPPTRPVDDQPRPSSRIRWCS